MNKIQFEQALCQMRDKYRKDQLSDKFVNYCTKEGLLELFDNLEQRSNKIARKIVLWMKEHNGKVPSTISKDPIEKKYGRWISTFQQSQKCTNQSIFYHSTEKIFIDAGYHYIFGKNEYQNNEYGKLVVRWMKEHNGKFPSHGSKDPLEKRYGSWIHTQRMAKKGKGGTNKFYPSTEKIFNEAGYPNIFNTVDRIKPEEVINWMKEHDDKVPSRTSKDPIEKRYGSWIHTQRMAKKGKGGTNKFYPSTEKIFNEAGYPDIFESRTNEK